MPLVIAIAPSSDSIRRFHAANNRIIRNVVSRHIGYPVSQIAFIPSLVPTCDMVLADNISSLELVIDAGRNVADHDAAETAAEKIKNELLDQLTGFSAITFGVWLRGSPINGYAKHQANG